MEKFRPPQPIPAKIFHTVEKSFPHRGKLPPRPSRHPLTPDLCPLPSFPPPYGLGAPSPSPLNPLAPFRHNAPHFPRLRAPSLTSDLCPLTSFPGCSLNPEPRTLTPTP